MARSGINGSGWTPENKSKSVNNVKQSGGRDGFRIEMKRERARKRQEAREHRTPEQQLALLDTRPGEAVKERARLHAEIEKRNREKKQASEES